jgi:hypothetical protein
VAVATAVAVTVLGRVELAVVATATFISRAPLLVAAVAVFRLAPGLRPAPPQ